MTRRERVSQAGGDELIRFIVDHYPWMTDENANQGMDSQHEETVLSRLLQKQGKREEARKLLGEIYSWFTEGFDTADLHPAVYSRRHGAASYPSYEYLLDRCGRSVQFPD